MPEATSGVRIDRADASCWRTYRDVRLAMLAESPRAFGSRYADVAARTDADWQALVAQGTFWLAYAEPAEGTGGSRVAHDGAVGSVGLFPGPEPGDGSAHLVGMWVAPGARRGGVGEALVRAVLAEAGARGLRRVVLEVADENTAARALYTRLGFTPTGRVGALPWDASVPESEYERPLTG